MNHPLTDEMCEQIAPTCQWAGDIGDVVFRYSDIRAAYDKGAADRLEQCIAWLENLHPKYTLAKHSTLANMMKEAMRPQQQEDK
jgi:hypothetical protein